MTRFFQHTLDEEQHQQILDWLSSCTEEEQESFFKAHLDYIDQQPVTMTSSNESGFEELRATIQRRERVKKNFSTWSIRIAAVFFPFLMVWALFLQPKPEHKALPQTENVPAVKNIEMNNYGRQNREITLPDSSVVTLYPGASLQYSSHFVQQKRTLKLRGKAFFNVKHDANHPFIVYSGEVQTLVLGTSFWVDAHPSATRVRVTVKTGKVGVKTLRNSTVFLLPDEQAVFIKSEGTLAKITTAKNSKKQGNQHLTKSETLALAFNETPLSRVATLLEEQFKLKIYLEDESLSGLHITLSTKGKSLESILEEIKAQAPVQYERKGREIYLKENKTIK
ncbi:protein of unknown function [Pedobacter steynii]|uniref:Ferric-dicitrate binding protein FerR, regulates iron transport through sigma-19 n=2 Tax=Pedobacter steynii TaxID=430522 RepID=A0A1H0D009_9SPHI|nr:protein of unknown function [Pedobacter steynii]